MRIHNLKTKSRCVCKNNKQDFIYFLKTVFFARPQALTCQGRRWSAAAAHAKGPARPVLQSAFRAKGLWRKNSNFLNFLKFITQIFFKTRVALPEATPSPFGCASLHPPSLCSGSARRPNALRAAQQTITPSTFHH